MTHQSWIAQNWGWVVFLVIMFGGGILEAFGHFVERIASILASRPHVIAAPPPPPAPDPSLPGPCRHRVVMPVVSGEGDDAQVVAWLCKNETCRAQLPPDWAVRREDLG